MSIPLPPILRPEGADNIAFDLPLPWSEQHPPELPDLPVEPEPAPGGEATTAT
ncbi:hypothetical protein ACWENO_13685 [Streptomyces sp. NPDC004436]